MEHIKPKTKAKTKILQVCVMNVDKANSNSENSTKLILDNIKYRSSLSGYNFVELFYKICDTQRNELINFFKKNSFIINDGIKIVDLLNFYKELPLTKHIISSIDVQSIPNCSNDNIEHYPSLLIHVIGHVEYGVKSYHRGFSHSFILENDYDILNQLKNSDNDEKNLRLKNMYYIVSINKRTTKVLNNINYF